jgi:hypothetical protein
VEGDRKEYEDGEKEWKRKGHERKYETDIKKFAVMHNTTLKRNQKNDCIKYVRSCR